VIADGVRVRVRVRDGIMWGSVPAIAEATVAQRTRGGHVQKEKKESRIYHHGNFSGLKGKVVRYKWIAQR
jgi:hypothetical protein